MATIIEQDDIIAEERDTALPNASDLLDYRDYSLGRQSIAFSEGERRILKNLLGHKYSDNLAKLCLSALRNPLKITRWDVGAGEGAAEQVREYVDRTAMLNNLPNLARRVHWAMLRDGDHVVALKWYQPDLREEGRVLLQRESWWNGTKGVWVIYDDDDRMKYAAKEWSTADGWRRVLWYPDRIERYVKPVNTPDWIPYHKPDLGLPAVSPWKDKSGQPLNPPIVHFSNDQIPNDGRGDDEEAEPDSRYGISELDGVLAIQDGVNDIHRDVLGAARFIGFPMLMLSGVRPQIDNATGDEIPLVVEPGAVLRDSDPAARASVVNAPNIDLLEQALMLELRAFSRVTSIPVHHITGGDWPSGTALILSMTEYFDKLQSIADSLAPTWGSVMHKATRLANTFGRMQFDENEPISAVFAPVIRYDSLTLSQVAAAIAPFVSRREVLRRLDYTPDEQDTILREMDEDMQANPETQRALAEVERTRLSTESERRFLDGNMAGIEDRLTAAAGGVNGATEGQT